MRKLIQIIDSIDQKLIDNGFSNMQIKSMTSNQGQITIFECIKEVLENRGRGLYKYFDELYSESHYKNDQ